MTGILYYDDTHPFANLVHCRPCTRIRIPTLQEKCKVRVERPDNFNLVWREPSQVRVHYLSRDSMNVAVPYKGERQQPGEDLKCVFHHFYPV